MDKLAFINGESLIYWNSIVYTLAAATAICFFLAFYLDKRGNAVAGFAAVPLSMAIGLVAARFFHWYCRADSYEGFVSAMTDYTSGGYALMGIFLGCFLAAAILRLLHLHTNLPKMLDCMSVSGCAGIAVGRLASLFNASDRGQVVQNLQSLPFVYPVTNAVSGVLEYRLATFMLQSMVALLLFAGLTAFYLHKDPKGRRKDGDTALIFLLIYGASQVVLDSTRYDSLFFRSNGFVSVVQVLGALGLALTITLFSRRMVKAWGLKFWQFFLWIPIAAGIGCGGFMEYYVQRRGNEAAFAYSVMSGCLLGVIGLTLLIRFLAAKKEEKEYLL